jgi:hypothetical protein
MKKNIGSTDSLIRIIIGIIIIAIGLYFRTWWGLIAIIPFTTAFIKFCPVYLPFGINTTCKSENKTE